MASSWVRIRWHADNQFPLHQQGLESFDVQFSRTRCWIWQECWALCSWWTYLYGHRLKRLCDDPEPRIPLRHMCLLSMKPWTVASLCCLQLKRLYGDPEPSIPVRHKCLLSMKLWTVASQCGHRLKRGTVTLNRAYYTDTTCACCLLSYGQWRVCGVININGCTVNLNRAYHSDTCAYCIWNHGLWPTWRCHNPLTWFWTNGRLPDCHASHVYQPKMGNEVKPGAVHSYC